MQTTSTVAGQVTGQATKVRIALTDLVGRTVRTIENSVKLVGTQTATLNTADVAAGTYLVRGQIGAQVATSKTARL